MLQILHFLYSLHEIYMVDDCNDMLNYGYRFWAAS